MGFYAIALPLLRCPPGEFATIYHRKQGLKPAGYHANENKLKVGTVEMLLSSSQVFDSKPHPSLRLGCGPESLTCGFALKKLYKKWQPEPDDKWNPNYEQEPGTEDGNHKRREL
jgi:hypothetical protein